MQKDKKESKFSRFKARMQRLGQRQERPPAPIENLGLITDHISRFFGDNFFVWHEKVSHLVHIDVHVVRPTSARPFFGLMTSGMSDLAMCVPKEMKSWARAEVCMCLPKEWPIQERNMDWATPEYFWPIKILKQIAKYPHLHKTWVSAGHTVSYRDTDPLDPAGHFAGVILAEPRCFPDGFGELEAADGSSIRYWAVIPLTKEELEFKIENGAQALDSQLRAAGVSELINSDRQSVIPA
jgi:hypothetical protein